MMGMFLFDNEYKNLNDCEFRIDAEEPLWPFRFEVACLVASFHWFNLGLDNYNRLRKVRRSALPGKQIKTINWRKKILQSLRAKNT